MLNLALVIPSVIFRNSRARIVLALRVMTPMVINALLVLAIHHMRSCSCSCVCIALTTSAAE